jgi:hypothetical protein
MGLQYKATDKLTFAFEEQNLTDATYKQYMTLERASRE